MEIELKGGYNMKTITLFVIVLLSISLVANFVLAQDEQVDDYDQEVQAGVAPDSIFHSWDLGFERMRLSFTRDKVARARLHLEFAKERLAEAEKLLDEGNEEDADKAQELHDEELAEVEVEVEDLESEQDGSQETLNDISELRLRLLSHRERIDFIHQRILDRLADRNASQEMIDHLEAVFSRISNKSAEIELKIDIKRERIKSKYDELSNKTEEELTDEEQAFLDRVDAQKEKLSELMMKRDEVRERIDIKFDRASLDISEKAKLSIIDARSAISRAGAVLAGVDDADRIEKIQEAKKTLAEAVLQLSIGNFEEAKSLSDRAIELAKESVKGLSVSDESKISIKAEKIDDSIKAYNSEDSDSESSS